MKCLIISVCLFAVIIAQDPVPPTWPVRFQQDFVQSFSYTQYHDVGKLWYDSQRLMSRMDRTNGRFNPVCASVVNGTTPCIQLVRDSKRYIIFPLLRNCCYCCDSQHGCGILTRDWLKRSKYVGKDELSGQIFNKFYDVQEGSNYWSTTDAKTIPRKLSEGDGQVFKDFIMNTYSEEYIADSIFALPSYCTGTVCPETSKCAKFRSMF